ncbi:MAG: hypothetical protein AAFX50_07315, partial [Acidobacteriota bacterium]
NIGPVMLRLVDPADELLSSLGVGLGDGSTLDSAGEPDGAEPAAGPGFDLGELGAAELLTATDLASPDLAGPDLEVPGEGQLARAGAADAEAKPAPAGLSKIAVAAAAAPGRLRRLAPAAVPLTLSAACIVALWTFLGFLRPSATEWRAVQLRPTYLASAGLVTLVSPDIDAWTELDVSVDGSAAEIVSREAGQLVVEVPDIDRPAGGVHPVSFTVSRGDEPLFDRRVSYVVHPQPSGLAAAEVEEGRLFEIEGHRLLVAERPFDVLVDGQRAEIRDASAERLTVKMPRLGLEAARPVSVVLDLGGLVIPVPGSIVARPRSADPLHFGLTPSWDGESRRWRLSHPFGVAFHVAGPAPAAPGGAVPDGVQRIVDRWQALLAAAEGGEVRVEAFSSARWVGLRVRDGRRTEPLVAWPRGRLAALGESADGGLAEEVRCHALAVASNRALDVFARGRLPAELDPERPADSILGRLVDASLAQGFDGRPDGHDLDTLGDADLGALEALFDSRRAWVAPTGRWNVLLENVFLPDQEYRVEMALDLEAEGRRLFGEVRVVLRGETMTFGEWTAPAEGRVELGGRPRVVLETELRHPLGELVLDGYLEKGQLAGDFTVGGEHSARWRARRLTDGASAEARSWGQLG